MFHYELTAISLHVVTSVGMNFSMIQGMFCTSVWNMVIAVLTI